MSDEEIKLCRDCIELQNGNSFLCSTCERNPTPRKDNFLSIKTKIKKWKWVYQSNNGKIDVTLDHWKELKGFKNVQKIDFSEIEIYE